VPAAVRDLSIPAVNKTQNKRFDCIRCAALTVHACCCVALRCVSAQIVAPARFRVCRATCVIVLSRKSLRMVPPAANAHRGVRMESMKQLGDGHEHSEDPPEHRDPAV